MSQCPFEWAFFDASDGSGHTNPPYVPENALGRRLTNQEIGCFSSHFNLLRDFVCQPGPPWICVIEDDVLLDYQFPFGKLLKRADQASIQYIRLYSRFIRPFRVVGKFEERQLIRYRTAPYGTQAYLMGRTAAARLISSVKEIVRPIDDELDRFWAHNLPIYAVFPYPAFEYEAAGQIRRNASRIYDSPIRDRMRNLAHRTVEKISKLYTNMRLASSDRRLRRQFGD
jgi:glycosyl transferase, family 25